MESAAQRHRGRRRGGARSQPPSARPAGRRHQGPKGHHGAASPGQGRRSPRPASRGPQPKEQLAERDARSAAQRQRKRKEGQGTLASHPAPSPRDTGAHRPKGHREAASPGQGRQGPQTASRGAQPQRTSTTVTLDGQGLSGLVPIHKESRRKPKVGVLKVGGRNS